MFEPQSRSHPEWHTKFCQLLSGWGQAWAMGRAVNILAWVCLVGSALLCASAAFAAVPGN
jgi:hypothetical protein